MGKANKGGGGGHGKRKQRRHNPVRVPDNHLGPGVKVAEQTSVKGEQVIPVLQKLDSADGGDRLWACAAVTNLIQNDASTRRLLQAKGVVPKLITRLTDTSEEVVVEAAGSLRNLCVDGGYDMCGQIFNKNVLAPLKTFVPKIIATLQEFLGPNPPKSANGIKGRIYEFSENIITIFWCLSETSNKALNAINEADLTPFLMAFLMSRDKIPTKTVVAAVQCLYVLSDDNDPTINAIRKTPTYLSCLLDIVKTSASTPNASLPPSKRNGNAMLIDPPNENENENENEAGQKVMLKVLACGVLRNIAPIPAMSANSKTDFERDIALPLLVPLLDYSIASATVRVQHLATIQSVDSAAPAKPSLQHIPDHDHKTSAELELEDIEGGMRTVELAVEIMTSVCAKLPDPEPGLAIEDKEDEVDEVMDEDDEADDDADEDDDDEIVADDEDRDTTPTPSKDHTATFSLLPSLVRPLLHLSHPTSLSFSPPSAPPIHPPTTSVLSRIHIHALECLNNLFIGLNPEETTLPAGTAKEAVEIWKEMWEILAGSVGRQSEWMVGTGVETRREMWEIGVGVLWGLARIVKDELIPDAEHIQALIEFCESSDDEMIKAKCIGTLGGLAQRGDAIEANKDIASYLFTYLQPPASTSTHIAYPEAVLHAASTIVDIFADETKAYDVNFNLDLFATVAVKDRVKRAVKAIDRTKEGGRELREFGEGVLVNLDGFVKYRQGLERKRVGKLGGKGGVKRR
ncbi:hypothetical protein FRB95_007419 [Tulasnella sp. JGI-2019a]|nr:hypothetical protein FRB95_007419 [Tulasnella sp. JGI-2019a]